MKKILPVFAILLIAVAGIAFYMGQQSNAPVVETPPAASSTPKADPVVESTPEITADDIYNRYTEAERHAI